MLTIKKGTTNMVVVTITQNQSAESPKYYLFSFVHILSKEVVRFYMKSTINTNARYDEYMFDEVDGTGIPEDELNGDVIFPYDGQYFYSVYEMPTKSLNPSSARLKLEEGRAVVYNNEKTEYYTEYISSNENNNNYIYLK